MLPLKGAKSIFFNQVLCEG